MIKLIIRVIIVFLIILSGMLLENKIDYFDDGVEIADTYTKLTDGCTYKNLQIVDQGFKYDSIKCKEP